MSKIYTLLLIPRKSSIIDPKTGLITDLIEINYSEISQNLLANQLKNTTDKMHKHDGIIKINKYLSNGIYKVAWYDVKMDEIIFPNIEREKYFNYEQLQFLGRFNHIVYYFDPQSRILFQQDLFVSGLPNTKPFAIVDKSSNPYFNSHDGTIIYKTNTERDMPGVAKNWEYTVSREFSGRSLLQIEIKNNEEGFNPDSIETILKKQRAFNIKQPIKISDPTNEFVGCYLNKNVDLSNDKLVIATHKLNKNLVNPEYAGYVKRTNGNYIYFFTTRDPLTQRITLYKQEGERGTAEKISIPPLSADLPQTIISVSVVKNQPLVLTDQRFIYYFNNEGEFVLSGFNFVMPKDVTEDLKSVIKNIISLHPRYSNTLSLFDANGSLAWYDVNEDIMLLFNSGKKYIGKDEFSRYYFLDEETNKIYFKNLKTGNIKNYSLTLINNKLSLNSSSADENLEVAKNFYTEIKIDKYDLAEVPTIIEFENRNKEYQYLESFLKGFERAETVRAKVQLEKIINESKFIAEQEKLDAEVSQRATTPRRSILFVNNAWHHASIEIFIQDETQNEQKLHSWWGQKSNYTISPLIPINTKKIKVSVQSWFLQWSSPYYEEYFTLSDLPLCLASYGTLFSRSVIRANCNK